jgi:uncharacterized protein YfaS (alpha-2-macroglobulin family)
VNRRIVPGARSLAVLALSAALLGCGGKHPPRTEVPAGSLTVATVIPRGATDVRTSVDVIFDRPVAALGASDPSLKAGEKLLRLDPRPDGYYHWVGTRTLSYVVPDGLPPATAFKAEVPAGVKAVDGTRLEAATTWEFETPRPELVRSIPAKGDSLFRPDDPLVLVFNQPMDPHALEEAAELERAGPLTASRPDSAFLAGLGWAFRGTDPERAVALRPDSPLDRNRAYTLRLEATLRGRLGPLPLAREVQVPFRTYGPPGLVSARADRNLSLVLRTPVDPDTLRRYLALDPPLRAWNAWSSGTRVIVPDLAYGTAYAGTLRVGMPDEFGQTLERDVPFDFTTSNRPPTVRIFPSGSVLTPDVPRRVVVRYGGSHEVRVRAVPYTVADEVRSRRRNRIEPASWALDRVLYRGEPRNALTDTVVDLSALLPDGLGAVLVEASTTDPAGPRPPAVHTVRTVLRWSGLGLTTKTSFDTGEAWVTRLTTGEPVAGAGVAIREQNGTVLWEGRSGAGGTVALPGFRSLGVDPWRAAVTAESPAGAAIDDGDGDWRLSPWRFHLPGRYGHATDLSAFIYGDRNLYRPGETVHLAGLVRRLSASGVTPAGLESVRVAVRDPRGSALADSVLGLDALGGFALDVPTSPDVPVGTVDVGIYRRPAEPRVVIGSGTVRIAAYRAPTFKASVDAHSGPVYPGGTVSATVSGSYYFGTPLAGADFTWTLVRERVPFQPAGFDGFTFGDVEAERITDRLVASGKDALGENGTAEVVVPLPTEPFPSPLGLTLEANVKDPTGDVVSARGTVLDLPAAVIPGVAAERDFVAAGSPLKLRLVAVRGDTARAEPGVPLTVRFIRREWRSVRKLLVGGRVGYETSRVDTLLESRETTSEIDRVTMSWVPPEPGSYRVEVIARDADGRTARSAILVYAAGEWLSSVLAPHRNEPYLDLAADREVYRPGETARILLTTPVRARRGVLTIEREGVIETRVVALAPGSPVFEVPIKASYMPNVFVGLSVVEPALDSTAAPDLPPEARLPQFKAGYVKLALDTSAKRLAVAVETDRASYAPADTARVTLRVTEASGRGARSRVSVAVVDEAVLALLQNPNPDPHGFFYATRGLGVMNDDTRLRLGLGAEHEAGTLKEQPGGGGAEGPAFRSVFATTAYWNAAVMTDAAGRATVLVPLPENLTRFRVVATAASGSDLFGGGEASFRVTKPLTVEPALPRFARAGDRFEAAALVTNRTDHRLQGTVTLVTGLAPEGKTERRLGLDPGRSARVAFPVGAEGTREVDVGFRADFGEASDAVRVTLPVERAVLDRAAAAAGNTTGSRAELIALPTEALPGTATLEASLSPSVISGAERAFRYVVDYRYGCIEQTSSRLLLLALYKELTAASSEAWIDSLDLDAKLAETVKQMESLVTPWGGLSFWPGGTPAPAPLAAYAAYALLRAERAGVALPGGLLNGATAYLQRSWRSYVHRSGRGEDLGMGSPKLPLGIFLFAAGELSASGRAGLLEPGDLDAAVRSLDSLAPDDRLFLALALLRLGERKDVASRVLEGALNRLNVTAAGATAPAVASSLLLDPFRTPTRATALTLLLAERMRPEGPRVPQLAHGLLDLRRDGHWGSTHDDALALIALTEYRERVEKGGGAFTGKATLRGLREPVLQHSFRAESLAEAETTMALPANVRPGVPVELRFERTGRGNLYYEAVLRWREDALDRAPRDGGYTLLRSVDRLEGKGTVRVGDLMVVTLTLVLPRESYYLAVRDPLPAGLEPVETRFKVSSVEAASRVERRRGGYPSLPLSYVERRDREVRFFADRVSPGIYQVRYLARVRAAGEFGQPPASVEAMYTPELSGASASGTWEAEPPR